MNGLLPAPLATVPTAVIRTQTPLDEVERAMLATLISVMTDPAMADVRTHVREGMLALCIEGDEVTWEETEAARNTYER